MTLQVQFTKLESVQHTNNKKRSHTQLDSRKQVIAFQDRVITKPTLPDPDGHGWHKLPDGTLDLKFFEKEAAPATLRDVTHLYCVDDECSNAISCQCLLAGLTCIETCSCFDCPNSLKDDCDEQTSDEET